MSFVRILALAIPCAVLLALWLLPQTEIDLTLRILAHVLAFTLSYVPYVLVAYWKKSNAKLATGAHLSANVLRILGIFIVLSIAQLYDAGQSLAAIKVYVISVGSFLIFQLVALVFFRSLGKPS